MTTIRAKNKKATPNICSEISNKISTREALSVVKATRQNVLEAFSLPSNYDKLLLVATKATFLSLAGFLPVKVLSKRHTWVSLSVVSIPTKSPKVFNNRPVNKLVFPSISLTPGASSTIFSRKMIKKTKSSEKWGQLLASAIVTLNPFVVPNKILDKISIVLSDTLSKMGQDQPLTVLPNMVSSGRSSPVLESKQFFLVGLSVLENWADQMETESSPFLVSGAISGSAWETITSYQRFAGWVASILVLGATFKIKLAHVKTVFQSVHGFLDAKSVLKDNLTSSVHLTTFKIAKFLVVSKSGSSSAAVALHDVLLDVSAADIKTALSVFGMITCVVLKPVGIWQYVVVHFENLVAVTSALNHWSVLVDKDSVQILSVVNQQEAIMSYNRFKTKLVNLPPGCTAFEISDMISQVGGQTCFISWSPDSGHCFHFALVTFGSQAKLNFAVVKTETGYLAVDYKMFLLSPPKTSKVFNSHFVSNVSYAKASATLSSFGFPPLVASDLLASSFAASSAASIADSAIKLRLNSMEKQILDLTALVKSVIEPIGSLVTLVIILLNDNAVKTLKVEKDLLTMYNASKGFAELLIGVSKDFASLKTKVEFSNLDKNDISAAKASPLSEDTVDHTVALWQMCSPEVKDNTTVGLVIAVMKKTIKVSGSESGFKTIASRKKRKEDGSETGNTTESESIDMEDGAFVERNPNQMPKNLHIMTKKVLEKPLGVIDYDIDLMAIAGKFSQKKLSFIRKIFLSMNGFERASTPSKFGGIIRATFTLEKAMMTAEKLANDHSVVINTNFKHPVNNCTNRAIVMKKIPVGTSIEAVHAAMSEFGLIKTLLYTLPVGTNAHDLWDFIGLVGEKTCVINHNPVSYTHACYVTVCFGSESDLVSAMAATPVIKEIGLHWSHLSLALCSVCSLLGHTSLNCVLVKVGSTLRSRKAPLFAWDQVRLVTIYAWKSTPISRPLAFSGKTWASVVGASLEHSSHGAGSLFGSDNVGKPLPSVVNNLEKYLVNIESGLISFTRQIGVLAKRLDLLVLAVFQPSPGCQLSVTLPSQNQGEDIVMGVGSSKTIGDETTTVNATVKDLFASPYVAKLENMLKGLTALVLSLSAYFDGDMNNLVSIFTETKLKNKVCLWMATKFGGVQVFSSGLNSGYVGAGVAIVINNSLAKHVYKVSEVSVDRSVTDVLEHFDTDHKAVTVFVGLRSFLDVYFSSLHKQANKDCWKFDVKGADDLKWCKFKAALAANATVLLDAFDVAQRFSDLDGLLDPMSALEMKSLFLSGSSFDVVRSVLAKIRKFYHSSKLLKSQQAEESHIKQAIDSRMESFESNKSHTIKSVLEHSFRKVVLDHLIVDDELILEPELVKSKVDEIMEGWTRKHGIESDFSDNWNH
ncbi:hypothetical protein G9A89_013761 [Geosiphon pyriformis]|nr:hypothetical protein G9A89_013761 [Geosiphon pyriformis]